MMGDSGGGGRGGRGGGGGGGDAPGNEGSSSVTPSYGQHYSTGQGVPPPFQALGSSMDRPLPPDRIPLGFPPSMGSPSFWHAPSLTPTFMSPHPGVSPAWPAGMDFASVGSGRSRLEGSAALPGPDKKTYDGQGRNILQVPSYHGVKNDEGASAGDGVVAHRESFSKIRGQSDRDNSSEVSKKLEHGGRESRQEGRADKKREQTRRESRQEGRREKSSPHSSTKEERPSSPPVYPAQSIFPQNEVRKVYSADTHAASQETESTSSYTVSSAAAKMNPDMLNVPFSSKAFASHLTEFSKVHGRFITPPPAPSFDAQKDRRDSTQKDRSESAGHRTSPELPEDCGSGVVGEEDCADIQAVVDCEVTTKKPEGKPSSSQAEKGPPPQRSQPLSSSSSKPPELASQNTSVSEQAAQSQLSDAANFVVTPSVYSDSDTDEYTEADYKPVIQKLAAKNAQSSPAENKKKSVAKKRTRPVRKSVRSKVVVKEEAESYESGSDYQPSPQSKSVAARERTPERVQPVRQKRRSVPSSFVEYYEDSDDSLPQRPTRKAVGKSKKPTSESNENQLESKTKKSSKTTAAAKRGTKGSGSKTPSNKTCPVCSKTFGRADSLTVHMRVHTGDRPFHCQECDATYKVSSHLRNHVRSKHSNVKAYKCDNCAKPFSTSNAKRRHEKTCGTDKAERVKHQCSRCQKRFVTEEGYEKHKSQNTCSVSEMSVDSRHDDQYVDTAGEATTKQEGKTFKCTVCPKAFLEFSGLETHRQFLCGKVPGAGPYTCSQCEKKFPRWNRFVAHCRQHTGDKPYTCSHCGAKFFDKDSLRKHISRHKGKSSIKCSLCEKQFTVKRTLAMHIMRVHCGMKPYKCNECDGDFASAKLLSTHIRRIHRKEKRFKCQLCGRAFFESQAWMKHMILHAGDRPPRIRGPVHKYPCNLCGKSLNMRLMRMHVEEDHPGVALSEAVTKTMVTCKLCKKEFSDPSSLKMHMIRHTGRKDFKCDKCDMFFITPAAMQLHQRKHSSDRPYACEDCGQTFRWRASLRDHKMHLHNPNLDPPDANGRRFGCKECGQRFKRYNTLRSHMIRHRGVMPCICSECGKGFTDNTRLKIHMSCHSGSDRPFICETCGAGFFYSFLLKRHIQSRHNPSPWLCSMCGRSLCSKDALKRHIQHHANSPDGKVRVGGNRGRPRKYRDPDETIELPEPKEPTEAKVKGKRGRKSKKTMEMLKQMEEGAAYQKVLKDEVSNLTERSGSSEPREMMMAPRNLLEPRETLEQRNAVEPRNLVQPQDSLESRNSVEPRNMLEPPRQHGVEPRNDMEPRNMMDPRNILMETRNRMEPPRNVMEPPRNVMEPRSMMEPRNMMEPRSMMEPPRNLMELRLMNSLEHRSTMEPRNFEPRSFLEPRNAAEPRNLEPGNYVELKNAVQPGNSTEPRTVMDPRNMMEPRNNNNNNLEPRSNVEPRTVMEPRKGNLEPRSSAEPRSNTALEPLPRSSSGSSGLEPLPRSSSGLEPLPEGSPGPSGAVLVELRRASEAQMSSALYAQHNFGYSPAAYMASPLLWPKNQQH